MTGNWLKIFILQASFPAALISAAFSEIRKVALPRRWAMTEDKAARESGAGNVAPPTSATSLFATSILSFKPSGLQNLTLRDSWSTDPCPIPGPSPGLHSTVIKAKNCGRRCHKMKEQTHLEVWFQWSYDTSNPCTVLVLICICIHMPHSVHAICNVGPTHPAFPMFQCSPKRWHHPNVVCWSSFLCADPVNGRKSQHGSTCDGSLQRQWPFWWARENQRGQPPGIYRRETINSMIKSKLNRSCHCKMRKIRKKT